MTTAQKFGITDEELNALTKWLKEDEELQHFSLTTLKEIVLTICKSIKENFPANAKFVINQMAYGAIRAIIMTFIDSAKQKAKLSIRT